MVLRYSERQRREFKRIFKADLAQFWNVLGFDVVKFDEELVKSNTLSVHDAVRQTYGSDGVILCQELLGMK